MKQLEQNDAMRFAVVEGARGGKRRRSARRPVSCTRIACLRERSASGVSASKQASKQASKHVGWFNGSLVNWLAVVDLSAVVKNREFSEGMRVMKEMESLLSSRAFSFCQTIITQGEKT